MTGKKNRIIRWAVCICLVICLLLGTGCGRKTNVETDETIPATAPADVTEAPTEAKPKELSISELLRMVKTLKDDLETVLDSIKEEELQQAEAKLEDVEQNVQTLRDSLDATLLNLGDSAPSIRNKLDDIQKLLNLVEMVSGKLLRPIIDQLRVYPASEIRVGEGMNTRWLIHYLDFLETRISDCEEILDYAGTVDLSLVDDDGKIGSYLETSQELLAIYRADESAISWMKTVLGEQGDRLYLIAPQNTAETRASGGFPGAMGVLRITDGVLTLGAFDEVYSVLTMGAPKGVQLTREERRLFNDYLSGMAAPRDADLCPDFERVAGIWSAGYEQKNRETLDGIISMTPHLMQRILAALDSEIQLADGKVLNGENATRILQYDIYMNYHSKTNAGKGIHPDKLFDEAAQKTMAVMIDGMSSVNLIRYMSVAKESFEDRTLMLWMADESEQEFITKMGWGGSLNKDPENPQAGIYFNCTKSSKMGIFLEMNTKMGERVQNSDGSYSYPITVTFSNCMTEKEWKNSDRYITGGLEGIQGAAYFFAPAGGKVSDFKVDGLKVHDETYGDLELGFISWMMIRRDKPITVTYTVTTAPGVETQLAFSQTPTLREFVR